MLIDVTSLQFGRATAHDAEPIAALHADSWRRHYRGAYSDSFLDGDVLADRRAVWTQRLQHANADSCTLVAKDGARLVGFAHTIFDADPAWGALLDNLHVAHTHMRRGIGRGLLALTAEALRDQRPGAPLHLWVLEQNARAQAFYRDRGGLCVERAHIAPPGGDPARINGSPVKLRFAWTDPARLLDRSPESPALTDRP